MNNINYSGNIDYISDYDKFNYEFYNLSIICHMRVAFLTAGGLAPCLSASIGYLIKEYSSISDSIVIEDSLLGTDEIDIDSAKNQYPKLFR